MLRTEIRSRTAWLMLDRPAKLNAMPRSFWSELTTTMVDMERDDDVHAVVFHGAGRCFSVGGDIEDFGNIGGVEDRRAYMREALGAFKAVEELPKPVIAAVHGHALGGGCELTLACDIVVADETATFGMPEAAVGLVPGFGAVRGLSHLNQHWMKYLVMTGLPITAQEAFVAGLAQRVMPPGEHIQEAERLTQAIVSRSRLALAAGKQILGRHNGEGWGYASAMVALLQGADDFAEGMAAFAERRPPAFG